MQTYLPLIQAMLSEWYLITLKNPLYAAALAIAVWLLTSILYSFRISSLNRAKTAGEKAGIENTNIMQKQLQESQEALAAATLQMEKATSAAQEETQRALTLEQLIYQRNKQVADIIQTLATSFDLGERPLLATEDVKADPLWQQHAKVITQLIERLRTEQQTKKELQQTYQTEIAKLAEKEVLVDALQSTLDIHTKQLSKLELVLEEQTSILQQQNNAQQALSDSLKNYPPQAPQPAKPIQEAVKPVIQPNMLDSLFPQTAAQSPTIEAPKAADQKAPVEPVITIKAAVPAQADIKPKAVIEETPYASLDIEQQPVVQATGSFGKIKNLFGKKQAPVKTEPQWIDTKSVEPEVLPLPAETEKPEDKAKKTPGKLQGLYSKFRSKGK
jgi:hypothetical protein